ncbi:hypothetical protein Golomagni_05878, partial [Golovinomyces magnicellulatus]
TDKGVLIAFRPNSKYAIPSDDGETIEVGPGCKWVDVYGALQPLGRTAVGGRLADVGVTGLLLGGGLSYMSGQHGLGCDNVVSYECVLANGTIVTATKDSHSDLFWALKGGGNQFAIVTKFVLKTYPVGENGMIWGGVRTFGANRHSELLAAASDFITNNKDPKAGIILTLNFIGAIGLQIPISIMFMFYDGTEVPAGVFDQFNKIRSLTDSTKVKPFLDLTKESSGGDLNGLRFNIRENTFPNLPVGNMTSFLNDHYDLMTKKIQIGALKDLLDFKFATMAIQPLPVFLQNATLQNGGNAIGLDPKHGDKIWVEYDFAWLSPLCDKNCPEYFATLTDSLHDMHAEKYSGIKPTKYQEGDLEFISYNPVFMNDAMFNQDVLHSYGPDNYDRLEKIQRQYDPAAFLSGDRQSGWKFK